MRNPFFWIGISFAAGIAAQRSGFSFPFAYFPGLAMTGAVALWLLRGTRAFVTFFLVLVALAGIFRAVPDTTKPVAGTGSYAFSRYATFRGEVLAQPEVRVRGKRVMASFILDLRGFRPHSRWERTQEQKASGRVQVFWIQPGFIPESGDTVELNGKIEAPRPAMNPGQFDHAKYLKEKNIFSVLQPIGPRSGRLVSRGAEWNAGRWIGRTRSGIAGLLGRLYPFPQSEILKALLVGIRGNVPSEIQSAFMRTGTVHLFATANTKRDFAPFSNKIIATYSP